MSKKNQRGFTFLEVIVTVVIISILAALALASYRKAIMYANESSAVNSLDELKSAQAMYRQQFGGYAADLPTLNAAGMIGGDLLATKHGYDFVVSGNTPDPTTGALLGFEVVGSPHQLNVTGYRFFCTDEGGQIKFANGAGTTSGLCNALITNQPGAGTL